MVGNPKQIDAIVAANALLEAAELPSYVELAYQFDLLVKGIESYRFRKYCQDEALKDCIDASKVVLEATKTI